MNNKKEEFNPKEYFFERIDKLINNNKKFMRDVAYKYIKYKTPVLFKILKPILIIIVFISFLSLAFFLIQDGVTITYWGLLFVCSISAFNWLIITEKEKHSKHKRKTLKTLRWNISMMNKSLKKYKHVDTSDFENDAINIIGDFIISYATGYLNSMMLIYIRL